MFNKFIIIFFLCFNYAWEFIKGDPGRDTCKIITGPGLKCSEISSYFFPYDTFLSFNDDLAHFTNEMKTLQIEHSNISILQSRSFQRTPHLSHLILNNIFLIEIEPGAFEGLKRLKLVDLSHNLLQTIPVEVFKYTKLNWLKLEGNALLEIPANGPILSAKFLTSFSLKNCNIHNLPELAFKQNPSLLQLDLSQNFLRTLPLEIFSNLRHLNFLDLSRNQFSNLEIKIFEFIPSFPDFPTTVILSNNPWVCDCNTTKLGNWLVRNVKTGVWSEDPKLSRLRNSVECQEPKGIFWNTKEFKNLISSC